MRNRSLELLRAATGAIRSFETDFAPWARVTSRISYSKNLVEIRVFGHRSSVPVFTVSLGLESSPVTKEVIRIAEAQDRADVHELP